MEHVARGLLPPDKQKTAAGIAPGRGVFASAWVSFATDESVSSSTQAKMA
jgi:hypothetical protein